ncbi:MAG: ribosome assembly RNA-binding protein YhbY [SAR324 cluster bacterium]|nr:ribosome assembly RNA-binding protein YhbY [SAR324 cluster bacterium]
MTRESLTGKQKRYLRKLAHLMKPVVTVGKSGLSEALYQQIDQCLLEHELIKIKVLESSSLEKRECSQQISEHTQSHVAQLIGRIMVLYRAHPEEPVIQLPM